jgi:membrane protein DedA with SNARE-associated domain
MIVFLDFVYMFFIMFFATFAIPTGAIFFLLFYASSVSSVDSLLLLMLFTFLGSVIGDISSFFLARRFRVPFQRFINSRRSLRNRELKAERFFHRHGCKSIFLTKFIASGIGPFFNYYAGLKHFSVRRFVVAVVMGEFVYAVGFALLGYVYRDTWQDIISLVGDFSFLIIVLLVLFYVVFHLVKHYRGVHKSKFGGVKK